MYFLFVNVIYLKNNLTQAYCKPNLLNSTRYCKDIIQQNITNSMLWKYTGKEGYPCTFWHAVQHMMWVSLILIPHSMTDNMGIVFPLEPEGKEELLPSFSQWVARVTDLVHRALCAKNSLQLFLTNRSFQAFHHILQTEQHSQTTYFSSLLTFLIH